MPQKSVSSKLVRLPELVRRFARVGKSRDWKIRVSGVAGMVAEGSAAPSDPLGKYDSSFELAETEALRRDVPKAQIHSLDAGHFALDTTADEIADLIRDLMSNSQ